MKCLNTKGKYVKVTNRETKWSFISKSVMIIIFVEFIDQLIDYSITFVIVPALENIKSLKWENTVKSQWLEHLWDHVNSFETWVVRATEG